MFRLIFERSNKKVLCAYVYAAVRKELGTIEIDLRLLG
jgi:hypothetical protein